VVINGLDEAREMVVEGMISIAHGENPRSVESKLQAYLH
jgi:flagellar motor component MotA